MPTDLLFEIGTEEIPAGFLARALRQLVEQFTRELEAARLACGSIRTMGTPRRLTTTVVGVADRQPDLREQVVGPPARVAFDADGAPTKAAIGFAKRNGVAVAELTRTEVVGKKGEYVVCERQEPGRAASDVLPDVLYRIVSSVPWAKSMRWADGEDSFVRPMHWMLALFGQDIVPVSFAGVTSGRMSRGHRFLSPDVFELTDASADAYVAALRERYVIVDPDVRKQMIAEQLEHLVTDLKMSETDAGSVRIREDGELLDEVTHLVEYPKALCGVFDESFLEVPEEVIVSAMRTHQRYFAVERTDGTLINRFVTIAGTVATDMDVVTRGNQRVLAARLSDARFFFLEDRKKTLDEHARALNVVVFQSDLGSIGDKVRRVGKTAAALAAEVGVATDQVARANGLSKADLVTQMVYEFPDLQGVMGAHYARLSGEPADVSDAIREHYLPRGADDELPSSPVGAVLAIADRIDTLVGCFAVGLAPTGSSDPYGLRRAALGILSILVERGWAVPLSMLVQAAASNLKDTVDVRDEHKEEVLEFLRKRLEGQLADHGAADCIEAVLSAGFDYVPDVLARTAAITGLRKRPDFEPLAVAFKRVANILKGKSKAELGDADPELFSEEQETELWHAFCDIERQSAFYLNKGDYLGALTVLAELRAPVDRFFDAVLVMDEDARVRENRLALLGSIHATFNRIADFRQLAV